MAIRNIIFDLGGVLLNWHPPTIVKGAFEDPAQQALILKEVFEHPDWLRLDQGILEEEEAIGVFAERTGSSIGDMQMLMDATRAHLMPIEETVKLFYELKSKGYPLYCLSNMQAKSIPCIQKQAAFLQDFIGIVYSSEVKLIKPDAKIYQLLFSTYDIEASESVFIDDGEKNVLAAQALGCQGIVFKGANDCRQQLDNLL